MNFQSAFLIISILAGQLIKIPVGTHGGATLLDVTISFLCLLGLFKLKFRLVNPPLFVKAALIFIFIALISLYFTPLTLSGIEYLTSLFYILRFSLYILLIWLIYSKSFPSLRENISSTLLISGVGLAILGLLQFVFLPDLEFLTQQGWDPHYLRTVSTFFDPNFAGSFFTLTLLLAFQNLAKAKKRSVLIFILVYIALLSTFSRGAYLAFAVSFLTFSILKKSIRLLLLTIILSLILSLGFIVYQQTVAKVRKIDREQSASLRINTWQQGWELFRNNPILGVGFNTYRYAIRKYQLGDEQFFNSRGASANDSSLLHVASTTGTLGLMSFLSFIFILMKSSWNSKVLGAALMGVIAQSFFSNTLFYPFTLIWILLYSEQSVVFGETKKPKVLKSIP